MKGIVRVPVTGAVARYRGYRRTVCACGRAQRRLRVFGAPWYDADGVLRTRRAVRRDLRAQAAAWHPDPACDLCRRGIPAPRNAPEGNTGMGIFRKLREAGDKVEQILREELGEPLPSDEPARRPERNPAGGR
ncbi:hypothetical protein [Amycolatopsis dongchuanensis]|uniref:Uncharacterized protein n=1 Tax=Amycolatopsis dongchuanensis TaxID=1070866 RepID=A0ABP9QJG1_9PSEU